MNDVIERIVELVREDKELHDAVVRAIHAFAEGKEIENKRRKEKYDKK